jgi:hypothetical protein
LRIGLEYADLEAIFAQLAAEDLFTLASTHAKTLIMGVRDAYVAEDPSRPEETKRKCPLVLRCSSALDRRIGLALLQVMGDAFGEQPHADPTGEHIVFVVRPDSGGESAAVQPRERPNKLPGA